MPRTWIQITALIAITVAVYMNAPQGQFMNIDDNLLIYNNPKVQEFTVANIKEIFSTFDPELYIPFTLLSYQIEYLFVGENPSLFHTTNVILHLLNVLLVFALIRFFNKKWFVPFITASLFAIHPINTEAVMWISGRKDLLSAFFFLGSLVLYCRHRLRGDRLSFYGSLGLFVCALLSKIIAVTLPLVTLIIHDIQPTKNESNTSIKLLAFGVPAIVFLGIGMMGKSLAIFVLSYFDVFLMGCKSIYFYLQKLVLPTNLSMVYEQITPISIFSSEFLFPILILVALGVITITSRAFSKILSFGMLWYVITLLPNLGNSVKGVENTLYYASDRYAYLPSIGIFFIAAMGVAWVIDNGTALQKKGITIFCTLVIGLYAFSTYNYAITWLTPEQNHTRGVELYPESFLSNMMVGMSYIKQEKSKEAIPHLEIAVARKPLYPNPRAHLGLALVKTGEIDRGIAELKKSQRGISRQYSYTYVYLAYAYMVQGQERKAEVTLSNALARYPENPTILRMYGTLEHRKGNLELAEEYFRKSISLDDTSVRAKAALARLLREKG